MAKKQGKENPVLDFKKLFLGVLAAYVLLIVCFYFLAGEQLHLRESRGNLMMPTADAGAAELAQGVTVEQSFYTEIQRLESVSVQWGTYYRPNAGTVTMELVRQSDGTALMQGSFDAGSITEGQVLTISSEDPVEGLYDAPLVLRIFADSQPGSAAAPMMNSTQGQEDGFSLSINGASSTGMLCFSASGTDYIWTGLHYWEFAAAGFGLLALLLAVVWYRQKKGKHSYLVNAVIAVQKYRFLIRQLVSRDFKTKYKRSVLGMFWSFLNPLLTMTDL